MRGLLALVAAAAAAAAAAEATLKASCWCGRQGWLVATQQEGHQGQSCLAFFKPAVHAWVTQ